MKNVPFSLMMRIIYEKNLHAFKIPWTLKEYNFVYWL